MRKAIFLTVLILLIAITFYVYWFYYNSKSDGSRTGYLQKISHKGNVFKTSEGEMVLGGFGQRTGNLTSNYFYFSIADEALADSLDHCEGKSVRLHYVQYRRSLPWRGENYNGKNQENGQYIIDHIEAVDAAPSGQQ